MKKIIIASIILLFSQVLMAAELKQGGSDWQKRAEARHERCVVKCQANPQEQGAIFHAHCFQRCQKSH